MYLRWMLLNMLQFLDFTLTVQCSDYNLDARVWSLTRNTELCDSKNSY